MKTKFIHLMMVLFTTLLASTSHAFSQSPFSKPSVQKLSINLFSENDSIDIINVPGITGGVFINFTDPKGATCLVTRFEQDGPSRPDVVSVFKGTFHSRATLFVIVKWHYYLPGVDTEGNYYEVHAYVSQKDDRNCPYFIEDMFLSNTFGSGFEGKKEGKLTYFPFKNAASIKAKLAQLNN